MAELIVKETGVVYDDIIGDTNISTFLANIDLDSATAALKKGTLLAKTTTGYVAVDTTDNKVAVAVLAKDITLAGAAAVGTAYTKGAFVRERLIVPTGDTVAAHEAELRSVGIYVTAIKD